MENETVNLGPENYINRELAWLEFNQRVLDEAADSSQPLLERVKFLSIVASNLDEYFEIRVAGLKQQEESEGDFRNPDGLTPRQQLSHISARVHRQVGEQYRLWREQILPSLEKEGLLFINAENISPKDRKWVARYFETQVAPVLTPLAVDPAHPFPQLLNKSLNLALTLVDKGPGSVKKGERLALVQVPRGLPRLVQLPPDKDREHRFIFLVDLMGLHVDDLFPNQRCLGVSVFRVTRNSNLYLDPDESASLLETIESELRHRRRGEAVRLEISSRPQPAALKTLMSNLGLSPDDLYEVDGPVNMQRLMAVRDEIDRPDLKDPVFNPAAPPLLREKETSLFDVIKRGDILLHHPYESFGVVTDFIDQAAHDPEVMAIKQTLYRTGGDSPIARSLIEAVENGKQVTVLMELTARFEEEANIHWARAMEEAGVHVVYGMVGLKTHCKILMVIRREGGELKRYVHLGTGNYQSSTAKLYTDLGLFSCHDGIGRDVSAVFNMLTGFTDAEAEAPLEKLLVAPVNLRAQVLAKIRRETEAALAGRPARIVGKMNALVDPQVVAELYRASKAGVDVRLMIRGICCLRPGLEGLSDRIRVASVVDRYLEHSRIFYFFNGGNEEVWLGSSDWMPRNFDRRVEVMFPVEDESLKARVIHEILSVSLADNVKGRVMEPDGNYRRPAVAEGQAMVRSQQLFMELSQDKAVLLPLFPEIPGPGAAPSHGA